MATFSWKSSVDGTWAIAGNWTLVTGTGTPPPGSKTTNTDVAIITKLSSTAYTGHLGGWHDLRCQ